MRPPGSDARTKSSGFSDIEPMTKSQSKQLVVCVENDGYPASLERRKLYVALLDAAAEKRGLVRVIDDRGEGSLLPEVLLPLGCIAAFGEESNSGRGIGFCWCPAMPEAALPRPRLRCRTGAACGTAGPALPPAGGVSVWATRPPATAAAAGSRTGRRERPTLPEMGGARPIALRYQ